MLSSLRVLLLGLVLVSPSVLASFQIQPTPDWVVPVSAPEPNPNNMGKGLSTEYLLVDYQKRYDRSNQFFSYRHFVEHPLTQDGLVNSGKVEIFYRPAYQHVWIHDISVIRNGKNLDRLTGTKIRELDVEPESSEHLYTGEKQLLILLPDLRMGDKLSLAYTIVGRNPVFGQKISSSFSLGWSAPVERLHTRLVIPNDRQVQHKLFVTEQEPEKITLADDIVYRWQQDQLPIYSSEEDAASDFEFFPYVQYSEFQNWGEVSDWAEALFVDSASQAEVKQHDRWQEWFASLDQLDSLEAKVLQSLKFTQDHIRYVGIELGVNSHKPHSPYETLVNGYGDCKDKTLLLITMLKELGVEAEPVLVNTSDKGSIEGALPTPHAFNHVITRISFDGKQFFVDPTRNYQTGSELGHLGYYSYDVGLPIYSGVQLQTMPWDQGKRVQVNVVENFQSYGYQQPVLLSVESQYTGREADYQRYRFNNVPHRDIERDYLSYYHEVYRGAELHKPIEVTDDPNRNLFTVKESYWINSFWNYNEDEAKFEYSINASVLENYLKEPGQLKRRSPLDQSRPKQVSQRIVVHYPEMINATDIEPLSVNLSNDFVEFSVVNRDFGQQTIYDYHYRNRKPAIPPKAIVSHAKMLEEARKHLTYSGWIRSDGSETLNNAQQQLMDSLFNTGDY